MTLQKIEAATAPTMTSPNPMTLICCETPDGATNMATLAFWTYLSFDPGMMAFSLNKGSFTGECVRENGKVVLVVPGEELLPALISCGTSSGRDTNKVEKFGIAMEAVEGTSIQVPAHAKMAIVAHLRETVDASDHILHICEIDQVLADESEDALFSWNGYAEIAPARKK